MTQRTIEVILFCMALHAWLASRDEQQRLQSTLATQKKLLDAADARESGRNATLTNALEQIAALKRTVQTPQQIVRDLPKYISLPQPITLQGSGVPPQKGTAASGIASAPAQSPASGAPLTTTQNSLPDAIPEQAPACDPPANCAAQIPPADLKPLYDYVQDCRACQAELAVAKQNAADDAVKIAALTSERDAAITASKGGTFWRRLRRNALWFAVGAAAGSAAGFMAATH